MATQHNGIVKNQKQMLYDHIFTNLLDMLTAMSQHH